MKKIVWALDPMDRDTLRLRQLGKLINLWTQNGKAAVLPVSVLSPYDLGLAPETFPFVVQNLEHFATRELKPRVRRAKVSSCRSPKLFVQRTSSRSKAVRTILDYAIDHEAGVIAASTQGRHDLEHWSIGSFVEKLMINSTVPVLTVNPKTRVPKTIRTIFFPTDFSPASDKVFSQVLVWARRFKARVIIYNISEVPAPWAAYDFGMGGTDPRLIEMAIETSIEKAQAAGEKLVKGASKQSVVCKLVLNTKPSFVEAGILANATAAKADLIVLTSTRGSLSQRVFGRTSRDVITKALQPVLTLKA